MSPSGSARRPRCPHSTTLPSSSLDPSPSSPASSSAPSWAPSSCSTTACAGNPTAGGDPASAGCTEGLCQLCPGQAGLHPWPSPAACTHLLQTRPCGAARGSSVPGIALAFLRVPQDGGKLPLPGGSSLQLSSLWAQADHKCSQCFRRLPKATLRSAYPLCGGIQVILLPLSWPLCCSVPSGCI